ncbi:MAG: FHA domain-containing protein [Ktedonobacterales bacterium]
MMTIAQAAPAVLAAGGLSSSVAVAAAALVVVFTIVLVFVMVLRSNGSARRSGSGLGYDAQSGPLGQPQNAMDNGDWRQQGGPGGWGAQQGNDMAGANAGRGAGGGWGQEFGGPGQQPGWGGQQQAGGGAWGGPPAQQPGGQWAGDQAGWNGQRVAAPSRPMAPAAPGGWDSPVMPGAAGGPDASSRPNWPGAPAQGGSPWGQGESAGGMAPAWNPGQPAQPTVPASGPLAPQTGQGWGGQQGQGWGGQQQPSQPSGNWGAGPATGAGWGGAAPGTQRVGVLVVRQGKEQGRTFEMRKDRTTLGRSRESDVFLEDLAVSRLHTTILQDNASRYTLRDEGSANGTYVNQQRVGEQVLEDGDEIQLGQTILVFSRR